MVELNCGNLLTPHRVYSEFFFNLNPSLHAVIWICGNLGCLESRTRACAVSHPVFRIRSDAENGNLKPILITVLITLWNPYRTATTKRPNVPSFAHSHLEEARILYNGIVHDTDVSPCISVSCLFLAHLRLFTYIVAERPQNRSPLQNLLT